LRGDETALSAGRGDGLKKVVIDRRIWVQHPGMPKLTRVVLCFAAACGGGGGGGGSGGADASNVPATITISGTASERGITGTSPVAGVTVGAYQNADTNTAVATTTTDASGNYTLAINTNGQPLDGFVLATMTGYVDTYLYPPAPLTADFSKAAINLVTPSSYGLIFTLTQVSQMSGTGLVALEVMDSTMATIGGATVTSTPSATIKYDGTNGLPDKAAAATYTDGVAYVLDVTAGQVTVAATMAGTTFKSHAVEARADKLTTTIITP
jgi:hypothetical protein